MKNSVRNPSTILLFSFFVSFCIFAYLSFIAKIVAIVASILITLCIAITQNKVNHRAISKIIAVILASSAISGVLSIYAFDYRAKGIDDCSNMTDTVTLRVTDCDYSLSYESRYVATVEQSDMIPVGTNILVTTEHIGLKDNTVLSGEITYSSLSEMNSSSFNAMNYYLPKKIMICAEDVSLEIIGETESFSINTMFKNINESLTAKITAHSTSSSGGLQSAVLLGNKDYLSDSTTRDFRRLGISHLLVVSGMHFAVIVSFIERALRRLRINKRYRAILNMIFIVFFMALLGFTPSVTRAGITCLIVQFAQIISRRASQLNSLAFAGCLMILINPYLAVDCGMQLSFIATYSCIIFVQFRAYLILKRRSNKKRHIKSKKLIKFMRGVGETVILTLFVNISMLPITCLYFGEISLLAIPSNIIFIPMITLLMYFTAIYLLLYPLRIFIVPISSITEWYCEVIEKIANWMASADFSLISINYGWSLCFIIPICVLVLVFPYVNKKHIKTISILALSFITIFGTCVGFANIYDYDDVKISYVSEKKNDGIAIKSNGKIMLCDFSDASFGFAEEMLEEITSLNSTEVESILFTHYHSKHVQLFNRMSDSEIIRSVILTEPINESEYFIYDSIYKSALEKGIKVYSVKVGEIITFGDAKITVFERKYISRSSHPITAMQISAHGEVFTYASGSFNESVVEISDSIEKSDFIILGKHSPVYKKKYALDFDETPKSIVVSTDSYDYMDDETKEYIQSLITSTDKYIHRIIIKSKE